MVCIQLFMFMYKQSVLLQLTVTVTEKKPELCNWKCLTVNLNMNKKLFFLLI